MRSVLLLGGLLLAAVPAHAQTAAQVIDSVAPSSALETMAVGDYPAMKRESNVVGAIQRAWDNAPGNAGIYAVRYTPETVFKIRVREFMTTTIVLPEWESVAKQILGDNYGFKVEQPQPHILVLRAAIAGADTTLTVIGESGRVYPFYVRSEGYNSDNLPDVAVYVKAARPDDAPASPGASSPQAAKAGTDGAAAPSKTHETKAAASKPVRSETGLEDPDWLKDIAFDPAKLRFDFTMSGDKSIAPDRVFSDGIFTYFDYGERWNESDLPVVYRVVDGVDTPVNTRSRSTMLIAESAGAFTLRNGQRVVCVRPENYVPDGSYRPLPKLQTEAKAPAPEKFFP